MVAKGVDNNGWNRKTKHWGAWERGTRLYWRSHQVRNRTTFLDDVVRSQIFPTTGSSYLKLFAVCKDVLSFYSTYTTVRYCM